MYNVVCYVYFVLTLVFLSHAKFAAYDFGLIFGFFGSSTSYDQPVRKDKISLSLSRSLSPPPLVHSPFLTANAIASSLVSN